MSQQQHTQEPLFLLDGARFKLSFHDVYCEECGAESDKVTCEPLGMYANDLNGQWVALVPAANDQHLELVKLIEQRDTLLAALEKAAAAFWKLDDADIHAQEAEAAIASVKGKPEQCEPVLIDHPLTWRKVTSVQDRGYKITGYALTNDQGQKCIVDMSAVRWFDDGADFSRMMHPTPAHCAHQKAETIHAGDGSPVEYCPDCGRNEAQPVRFQCDDTEGGAV